MPDTQFSKITLNTDRSISAEGPYNPGIAGSNWILIGNPMVIFMVVKNDFAHDPDLVADGIGTLAAQGNQPGTWTGLAAANVATGNMQVGDEVRAIGAAIQVKTDPTNRQNPPVVEVVTWCVPQTLQAP